MQDNTNITVEQILLGKLSTQDIVSTALLNPAQIDKRILFYCLNAIIHNRIDPVNQQLIIDALISLLMENHCWAAGALNYLNLQLPQPGILPSAVMEKINVIFESDESLNCPVCQTTEGLAFQFGWWGIAIDVDLAEQAYRNAIKAGYTPAINNLACLLITKQSSKAAYDLLITVPNFDYCTHYNLALCHLTGIGSIKSQLEADKKFSRFKASVADAELFIGQGQISQTLLLCKQSQSLEFTEFKIEGPRHAKKHKGLKGGKDMTLFRSPVIHEEFSTVRHKEFRKKNRELEERNQSLERALKKEKKKNQKLHQELDDTQGIKKPHVDLKVSGNSAFRPWSRWGE